jgi:GDP-L-fucose synthase
MKLNSRIYVAGHRGLVGSALMRRLQAGGYRNIITRNHAELDLTNQQAVRELLAAERPEYVFLAAAKVGGIHANNTYPAEFVYQNLAIQTNVIHEAWREGVKGLLFLGSSCIYPRDCPQPMKEEYLLTGPLEPTNRPYALAKIAGIEMCWAYNRQYGTRFISAMPTNCYGPGDNYDLNTSHVLPALIRKIDEAKMDGRKEVKVWGTGKPRREFIYSDDLADACCFLMEQSDARFEALLSNNAVPPLINIGTGVDHTILQLAEIVTKVIGFGGRIVFDASRPDGTPRKLLSLDRISGMGWVAKTSLEDGIARTYEAYRDSVKEIS